MVRRWLPHLLDCIISVGKGTLALGNSLVGEHGDVNSELSESESEKQGKMCKQNQTISSDIYTQQPRIVKTTLYQHKFVYNTNSVNVRWPSLLVNTLYQLVEEKHAHQAQDISSLHNFKLFLYFQ